MLFNARVQVTTVTKRNKETKEFADKKSNIKTRIHIMQSQDTIPQQLKDILLLTKITGTVIDACAAESTGGGDYPAYSVKEGIIVETLTPDTGDLIFSFIRAEEYDTNLPFLEALNIWSFYMCDDWTIEKLGTRQQQRFLLNECK